MLFAACGVAYEMQSGTITSPNFPNPYDADLNCAYFVEVEPGQVP